MSLLEHETRLSFYTSSPTLDELLLAICGC